MSATDVCRHPVGMQWLRGCVCVAVALACVALAGCSARKPGATGAGPGRHAVSAGPSGAEAGNVHLTDYTNNDSHLSRVILSGLIGDFGTGQRDGSRLRLRLRHGSFVLDIAALDRRMLAKIRTLTVDRISCSSETSASAYAPVEANSGTGRYRAIRGSFRLTTTLDEVYRAGACRETAGYLAQSIITTGWGEVSIR